MNMIRTISFLPLILACQTITADLPPCNYTGEPEHDRACRELREQSEQLDRQRQIIERQQDELEKVQQDMRRMEAEDQAHRRESDPDFRRMANDNPACANAMRMLQMKHYELSEESHQDSGRLDSLFGNAFREQEIKKYEKSVYRACNLPDPDCERARAKLHSLSANSSARKMQKREKKVREACGYLRSDPQ